MAKFYVQSGCMESIVVAENFMEAALKATRAFLHSDAKGYVDLGQDYIIVNELSFIKEPIDADISKRTYSFVAEDIDDTEIITQNGQIVLINVESILLFLGVSVFSKE